VSSLTAERAALAGGRCDGALRRLPGDTRQFAVQVPA
jgi:hypothetical protein